MKRRKYYMAQYEVVERDGRRGRDARYIGPHYRFVEPPRALSMRKYIYVGASALLALLYITIGLVESPGMRQMYVALFYVGAMLPLAYLVVDAIGFLGYGDKLVERKRDIMQSRFPACALAGAILMAAAMAGEAVYHIFFAGAPIHENDILILIVAALLLAGLLGLFFYARTLKSEQIVK